MVLTSVVSLDQEIRGAVLPALRSAAHRRRRGCRRTLALIAVVAVSLGLAPLAQAERVYLTVEEALADAFPKDVQVERKVVWITAGDSRPGPESTPRPAA